MMTLARHLSAKARTGDATLQVRLRWSDIVVSTGSTVAALALVLYARWVPGWERSVAAFALMAVGAPLMRSLATRHKKLAKLGVFASFWLLPCAAMGHGALKPLVDGLHPRLMDGYLASADLRLFGTSPSVWVGSYVPGWLNDVLLLCYYSYFIWPAALGYVLYRHRERKIYEQYLTTLALLVTANFIGYLLVPAVGPRFFLAQSFPTPLPGLLAPYLESAMRAPLFMKDCFPSGHTAMTLTVLTFAYRNARRFFWGMLPVGAGLIAATVTGRFHYGIDLVCAVPFCIATLSAANALARIHPLGFTLPLPVLVEARA